MKRILIALAVLAASSAFAADFYYNVVSTATMGKGQTGSIAITQPSPPIQFQTSGTNCKVFLNTTTAKVGWPISQNTVQQIIPGGAVTSLKFNCQSSATIYMVK